MRKLVSFLFGTAISIFCVSSVTAVNSIVDYKFSNTKVIYMGDELDLSGEKLLKLTTFRYPDNSENLYMPVNTVLDALGYYTTWDSYDEAIIASRYEKDINAISDRDSIDSSYDGKIIKDVSSEYLQNLSNTTWSSNGKNYYTAFKFLSDSKFEYIVKKHDEDTFDITKGTYEINNSVIIFKRQEAYKSNVYGKMITFAEHEIPDKIRIKQDESNLNVIYIGFSVNSQSFSPFTKE